MTTPAPVSRTGATDREVEAQMRERLIEFISWGETDDGRIGDETARQMLGIYDETLAARAAAAPDSGQREARQRVAAFLDAYSGGTSGDRTEVYRLHDGNGQHVLRTADLRALLAEQPGGGR